MSDEEAPDSAASAFPTECLECHALCPPGAAFCPDCGFETTHNKPINPATFNPPLDVEPPNPCRDRHWRVTGTSLSLCAWAVCTFFATIEYGSRPTHCSGFIGLFSVDTCGSNQGVTWFIFAVLYFLHFMEGCCHSGTEKFMANMSDSRQSADFLQNLTQAPPDMVWVAKNYHNETRSVQTKDGWETRTVQVVTSVIRAKVCRGLQRIP